jgi:mevalonate kinase
MQGHAPGKLILLGEHSVVYGHRAIAAAVGLHTRVRLHRVPGPTHLGRSAVQDPRLEQALAIALPAQGLRVDIDTELPVGRGMGSSAALSIALLRAADALEGRTSSFEDLHARGFAIEKVFHGNPSGLDHAVSALGGAVVYRKGEAPQPVVMPPVRVVVLDTGKAGDTASLVAGVASRRPAIDAHLDRLGRLVEESLGVLDQPAELGARMDEAHARLREIGVSTDELDELVGLARASGALGAKLSGAGGGGVALALTPDGGQALLRAARARGIQAFGTTLPAQGARWRPQ